MLTLWDVMPPERLAQLSEADRAAIEAGKRTLDRHLEANAARIDNFAESRKVWDRWYSWLMTRPSRENKHG